jgi:hypothetical protein
VYVTKSFKAALAAYPTTSHPADSTRKPPRLSLADRAHLKRWADDERADKVWSTINSAAQKRGQVIPDRFFIQEVLGARDIAESINHRRKHRDQYRKYAAQMERDAKTLRQRLPNGLMLIPNGDELAQKLDDAARTYRDYDAVSRNLPGVIKWTRESRPHHVFISQLSNNLRGITGRWLDYEVAVLTEIAFDEPEIDSDQVIWVRRGVKRSRPVRKRTK